MFYFFYFHFVCVFNSALFFQLLLCFSFSISVVLFSVFIVFCELLQHFSVSFCFLKLLCIQPLRDCTFAICLNKYRAKKVSIFTVGFSPTEVVEKLEGLTDATKLLKELLWFRDTTQS